MAIGACSRGQFLPLLLVLLLALAWRWVAATTATGCPGCARPRPADSIRLEAIKLQILTKLGLKAKPQVKRTLPRELVLATLSRTGGPEDDASGFDGSGSFSSHERTGPLMGSFSSTESEMGQSTPSDAYADYDDFYGRTSEIITFAEQDIPKKAHMIHDTLTKDSVKSYIQGSVPLFF